MRRAKRGRGSVMERLLVLSYPTISAHSLNYAHTLLFSHIVCIITYVCVTCLCDIVLANILLQAYCVGRNMECKFAQQKKRGPSKRQRTMYTEEGMQPHSSLSPHLFIFFGFLSLLLHHVLSWLYRENQSCYHHRYYS